MLVEPYQSLWAETLIALIKLFSAAQIVERDDDEELYVFDLEETGYQASFSKLTTASRPKTDPTASIADTKMYLVNSLEQLNALRHGFVPQMMATLPPEQAVLLKDFMQQAGLRAFD